MLSCLKQGFLVLLSNLAHMCCFQCHFLLPKTSPYFKSHHKLTSSMKSSWILQWLSFSLDPEVTFWPLGLSPHSQEAWPSFLSNTAHLELASQGDENFPGVEDHLFCFYFLKTHGVAYLQIKLFWIQYVLTPNRARKEGAGELMDVCLK